MIYKRYGISFHEWRPALALSGQIIKRRCKKMRKPFTYWNSYGVIRKAASFQLGPQPAEWPKGPPKSHPGTTPLIPSDQFCFELQISAASLFTNWSLRKNEWHRTVVCYAFESIIFRNSKLKDVHPIRDNYWPIIEIQ